jgi:hypothetical protein
MYTTVKSTEVLCTINIRKGMLLSRTNFVMMSNIMLMFLLLLFLAGDVEKNPGPMGTPVSETKDKSFTIFHSNIKNLRSRINITF